MELHPVQVYHIEDIASVFFPHQEVTRGIVYEFYPVLMELEHQPGGGR